MRGTQRQMRPSLNRFLVSAVNSPEAATVAATMLDCIELPVAILGNGPIPILRKTYVWGPFLLVCTRFCPINLRPPLGQRRQYGVMIFLQMEPAWVVSFGFH